MVTENEGATAALKEMVDVAEKDGADKEGLFRASVNSAESTISSLKDVMEKAEKNSTKTGDLLAATTLSTDKMINNFETLADTSVRTVMDYGMDVLQSGYAKLMSETAADAQAVRNQIDKESTEMYNRATQNVSDLKLNWTDSFKTYKAQLQGFETRAAANEEAADKSEKETEKSLQRLKKLQTQKFAIEGTGIDLKRFTDKRRQDGAKFRQTTFDSIGGGTLLNSKEMQKSQQTAINEIRQARDRESAYIHRNSKLGQFLP